MYNRYLDRSESQYVPIHTDTSDAQESQSHSQQNTSGNTGSNSPFGHIQDLLGFSGRSENSESLLRRLLTKLHLEDVDTGDLMLLILLFFLLEEKADDELLVALGLLLIL